MDHALIAEVQRRSTGASVHAMAQPLQKYQLAHELLKQGITIGSGGIDIQATAKSSETTLRQFVIEQRLCEAQQKFHGARL